MLCSCVAVAVGALAGWHVILITRGETSVEVYINRAKRKKLNKEGKVSCILLYLPTRTSGLLMTANDKQKK